MTGIPKSWDREIDLINLAWVWKERLVPQMFHSKCKVCKFKAGFCFVKSMYYWESTFWLLSDDQIAGNYFPGADVPSKPPNFESAHKSFFVDVKSQISFHQHLHPMTIEIAFGFGGSLLFSCPPESRIASGKRCASNLSDLNLSLSGISIGLVDNYKAHFSPSIVAWQLQMVCALCIVPADANSGIFQMIPSSRGRKTSSLISPRAWSRSPGQNHNENRSVTTKLAHPSRARNPRSRRPRARMLSPGIAL